MQRYIIVSPRGFSNETYIAHGSKAQCETACSIINNSTKGWAKPTTAKAIKRALQRVKADSKALGVSPEELGLIPITEDMLTPYRPQLLLDNGSYALGGPKLPQGGKA